MLRLFFSTHWISFSSLCFAFCIYSSSRLSLCELFFFSLLLRLLLNFLVRLSCVNGVYKLRYILTVENHCYFTSQKRVQTRTIFYELSEYFTWTDWRYTALILYQFSMAFCVSFKWFAFCVSGDMMGKIQFITVIIYRSTNIANE